uniref:Uncharacterized protein n=1 Tax=Anopheles atroparvus TaxID=41427 RepID=A0AAG5CPL0_ANOAO
MAYRCPRSSLWPPAPSDVTTPTLASSATVPPAAAAIAAAGEEASRPPPASVGPTRAGTVVCDLIGKFESTSTDGTADVKVTANSCRDSDSSLIAYSGGCPGGRGADRFRETLTGNRSECTDKTTGTASMGGGGVSDERSGEMPEMDASVHRGRKRQRKTVVYSRLCLDDAMMFEGDSLLRRDSGKTNGSGEDAVEEDASRRSWCSGGRTEVIRFPCVERLIELYANIIRQKEAEVQRFMSSIVREGDTSRLDKAGPVTVGGREWECAPNGSELRQGDIRKERALPASVSLESLPSTTTTSPKTVLLAADLKGDGKHASPILPIDVVGRTGRSEENPSPDAQSDEGWRSSTHQSPYGSSDEEERQLTRAEQEHSALNVTEQNVPRDQESTDTMKNRDKVTRSASSDSALGLDEELSQQEQQQMIASVGKVRRLTLGVSDIPLRSALLPVPEPATLPSPTSAPTGASEHCPMVVRSKMILEAQLIELPLAADGAADGPQHQQLGCPPSTSVSRRESAQSYISDTAEGVRYVRTPSVVVSDYSDDTMCGITLEEIEYFRRHRLRRGSADCESDISAASSCSNLNYCGSSISALEGCEYQCGLRTPERKVSDCSTCSTVSCDEDEGYSVVRSKLANLALPAGGTARATTEEASSATERNLATAEGADVRICSKKKVSTTEIDGVTVSQRWTVTIEGS